MSRLSMAAALLALPLWAQAVSVQYDLSADPAKSPFPTDRFTTYDGAQRTLKRVKLPKPNCTTFASDCADIDVINTLDGFNVQPRVTVPFDGNINPATLTSQNVYFYNLGHVLTGAGRGERVGINQAVWDPATKTAAFRADELLKESSRYVVVITNGVRDSAGLPVTSGAFGRFLDRLDLASASNPDIANYRKALLDALAASSTDRRVVVGMSLFTTQSITADLEKVRNVIKRSTPAKIDFNVGSTAAGTVRAVFPLADIAGIQFNRQTGTAPTFTQSFLPTPALAIQPNSVGTVAYGRFYSPNYMASGRYIPPAATLTGTPQQLGTSLLTVQLFLPAGAKPAGGYPVAIFGHGFSDSIYGGPFTVASTLTAQGIAVASINVVGHGGGVFGTLNVLRNSAPTAPVSVPAGGRGVDADGNGTIDATEGVAAAAPRQIISSRDGLRQTAIDVMQLVRQIETGVDVDGDGTTDLNPQRIYYAGQSFGAIYGAIVLGIEPSIKAGVPNVGGGSVNEIARLSPVFRPQTGAYLALRTPPLVNVGGATGLEFNENIPLRNLPPVTNTVAGAMPIQLALERAEWVQQTGNPVAYAPYITKRPLAGNAPKPVLVQIAKGDQVVTNPTNSALIRAGDFAARTTYFRTDLAYAANPAVGKTGHTFLTGVAAPATAPIAIAAQTQIAVFFATNGATIIDPDGAGPIFETPLVGPLPEVLNFIP
jgi:hypothetical protein